MSAIAFVVPVYRRFELTRICLHQLRRTCEELQLVHGLIANAVVVGDDENLDVADELGFDVVRQGNSPLGRKFNDGIEHAARQGADFVVPMGSDNWVDARLIGGHLPAEGTIGAHRLCAIVDDRGERLARLRISYEGGDGIRTIPTALLEPLGFRPAIEDRKRAIDTSMREQIRRRTGRAARFVYRDEHALQMVDFKSRDQQLNRYPELVRAFRHGPESLSPFEELARYYPAEAIADVRAHYRLRLAKVLCS